MDLDALHHEYRRDLQAARGELSRTLASLGGKWQDRLAAEFEVYNDAARALGTRVRLKIGRWHPEDETLKRKKRDLLDELGRAELTVAPLLGADDLLALGRPRDSDPASSHPGETTGDREKRLERERDLFARKAQEYEREVITLRKRLQAVEDAAAKTTPPSRGTS